MLSITVPLLISFFSILSFDWEFYTSHYKDLQSAAIKDWPRAISHFINNGIDEGRVSVSLEAPDTNFDWEYYVKINGISCNNEIDAIKHYRDIGYFQNLKYCKQLNIAILFHLGNLKLVDDFIEKINHFIRINELNDYRIYISIPIQTDSVKYLNLKFPRSEKQLSLSEIFTKVEKQTKWAESIITPNNCRPLYNIYKYLKSNIKLPSKKIKIEFMNNIGLDVGGFFLSLDTLINEGVSCDFIVKIHTKTDPKMRDLLTSFLNIKINKLLRSVDVIFSNGITLDMQNPAYFERRSLRQLKRILKSFNLAEQNFAYPAGNMFIVEKKFADFFRTQDLRKIYSTLTKIKTYVPGSDGMREHGFERFFGYLFKHLGLKAQIIDFKRRPYKFDNKISKDNCALQDSNFVRNVIKKHNIKIMAIYFPQFHEIEENNRFWGKGFTEWNLLNNYEGEKKNPHVDIGQYCMLDYSTRKKQRLIAKEHGIEAFCYYHYWFNDKKVMNKGIDKILEDGEPDLPFVLCWANEPWTRNWDGLEKEVLLEQSYGAKESWQKHYHYMLKFFKHRNYIKVDNCPLLYIYRIEHIVKNNALSMLEYWKEIIKKDGFNGLKIISVLGGFGEVKDLKNLVDGLAEHQPTYGNGHHSLKPFRDEKGNLLLDVQDFYSEILKSKKRHVNYSRGIFYGFDNSSRRLKGMASKFAKLSYQSFDSLIVETIYNIAKEPNNGVNYILLNSWNEWGEQAMVEPNDIDGYEILKVIKRYFGR